MQGAGVRHLGASAIWHLFLAPRRNRAIDQGLALEEQFMVEQFEEYQEFPLSPTISHIWTK